MKPCTVIGKIPGDYREAFGSIRPTDAGYEKFDELILAQIPDDIVVCGDELIADVDYLEENGLDEFDIKDMVKEAIDSAFEEMCKSEYSEYFEEE